LLEQVLVCLEGSPSSGRAVDLAIEIARDQHASLVGLAIGAGGRMEDFLGRCRQAGVLARALDERAQPDAPLAERLSPFGLTLVGRDARVELDPPADDDRARAALLHIVPRALLLVPDMPPVRSRRVMAAFDGSSASLRAIRAFADSGLGRDSEVHVVCVDDSGATSPELAARGVQLFQELGLHAAAVNVVSNVSIAQTLLDTSDRIDARLIVMGAYARSRVAELLWGAVTRTLTENTRVPLFLHH
jgi:nucleotide-binding universal stress UspA family protein